MSKSSIFVVLFVLISSFSYSQYVPFDWFAGKCSYSGYYDTTKIMRKQLDDTKDLCYDRAISNSFNSVIELWSPEKAGLDTILLKNEYDATVKYIKNLTLINSPFWEKQRQRKLNALNEYYRLAKLCNKGFKHPEVLKEFIAVDSTCKKYVESMIKGGDVMLSAWKSFRQQECGKSPNPNKCLEDNYLKRFNTKQKYDWARIDLMTRACLGSAIQHSKYRDQNDVMEKEFKKLFINTSVGCDK
jgi:hypothetical protein